jgi:hypothetical protein
MIAIGDVARQSSDKTRHRHIVNRAQVFVGQERINVMKSEYLAARHLRAEIHLWPATGAFRGAPFYLSIYRVAICRNFALNPGNNYFAYRWMGRPSFCEGERDRFIFPAWNN